MALNNISFTVSQGGLGRLDANADNVSAMMFALAPPSTPAWPSNKFKRFANIEEVKAAGITKGHATLGQVYYQAAEFFRMAPGAILWIGLNATLPTYTELFQATAGAVRQIGVTFSTFTDLNTVHQTGVNTLIGLQAPAIVIAGYQPSTATTLSTIQDLTALTASAQVSVIAAGDGAGDGALLASALSLPYIPALGAVLGAVASAKVSDDIAWVGKFNFSNGYELETIRLPDGLNNPTVTTLEGLDTKRYIVFRKIVGVPGTYANDSHTVSAVSNNDYAYLENNRTMQKARRLLYRTLISDLNGPLSVDGTTGKIAPASIGYFEGKVQSAVLTPLLQANEVSAASVWIDPDQNVLSTSKLIVVVRLVPVGVARSIEINIGFALATQL